MYTELMKCAEAGDAEAQYELGCTYIESAQYAAAFHWLQRAADQGHAEACIFMNVAHERFAKPDEVTKQAHAEELGTDHIGTAAYELGMLHLAESNIDKAHEYIKLAANHGHKDAQTALAHFKRKCFGRYRHNKWLC